MLNKIWHRFFIIIDMISAIKEGKIMTEIKMKKKILLIDDEPDVTMVIRSRLEAAEYDVEVANSGRQGLEKIESYQPDLVILDVMMEDLTGYDVCANIKNEPKSRYLPVIMLTSRIKTIDEVLGYACKADAYIRKPHSGELLLPEVKRLLNCA
jgi:DNA-binding response OmpR family regulator